MKPKSKKFATPLIIFIVGIAILSATWWINGAEVESLWFYLMAAWLVLYAAYEAFSGSNKRKDQ